MNLEVSENAHRVCLLVLDFICGAQSPPSPPANSYMERDLSVHMQEFQSQMYAEVRHGGIEGDQIYLEVTTLRMPRMSAHRCPKGPSLASGFSSHPLPRGSGGGHFLGARAVLPFQREPGPSGNPFLT